MPTTLGDMVVRIGSSPATASDERVAIDDATPYVEWDLPAGISQRRFNVRISNVEVGGFAYTTSGERVTTTPHFQFPPGVGLNENFAGICLVEVLISEQGQGEFEYESPPFYFAYDRDLEVLINSDTFTLSWAQPSNSDQLPSPEVRTSHLQISEDVLFQNLLYDNDGISETGSTIEFQVNPILVTLPLDNAYFWRVRSSDGMDFGDWSKVNAFKLLGNLPPSIEVTRIQQIGNDNGDVRIYFTVTESESQDVSAEFFLSGGPIDGDPIPMRFENSTTHIPAGDHFVIWKSHDVLSNDVYDDLIITSKAFDGTNESSEHYFGTFEIDNTHIAEVGGGIGATVYSFPVRSSMVKIVESVIDPEFRVEASVGIDKVDVLEFYPTKAPPLVLSHPYANTTLEERPLPSVQAGFGSGSGDGPNDLHWETPVTSVGLPRYTRSAMHVDRENPHTQASKFMFSSPLEYGAFSDAWPRPYSTKHLHQNQHLYGWKHKGTVHPYPDDYDWDNRPSWHSSREVWSVGDAWVQVGILKLSSYQKCSECDGHGWVASPSGPPYSRQPCPNSNCVGGFDTSQPHRHPTTQRILNVMWRDIAWYRLSTLIGRSVDLNDLTGSRVSTPSRIDATGFVAGRHLADLDNGRIGDRTIVGGEYEYQFQYDKSIRPPVYRDIDGGVRISGFATPPADEILFDETVSKPVAKVVDSLPFQLTATRPVSHIGPSREDFFFGSDPATHVGRPVPSQVGGMRCLTNLGRSYLAQPLRFVFLQAFWDAYNTIHWKATGSESSKFHVQYSKILSGNVQDVWKDAKADNGSFDEDAGIWLVDPLTFHGYWNTSDRGEFEYGESYRLRVRQYDTLTNTFTGWSYSNPFQIMENVPNPVSILNLEYEPWSRDLTITFRVDDSEGDHYNLTVFKYSTNDGESWIDIQVGDVVGTLTYLESTLGQNTHKIIWKTRPYNLPAGDEFRLWIEALPSDATANLTVPLFKWLTPVNPIIDFAEDRLAYINDRLVDKVFNNTSGIFEPADPPVLTPGRIRLLEFEMEDVRSHPAPDGVSAFLDQYGSVIDQAGYDEWLSQDYSNSETHDAAMQRIATEIHSLQNEVPQHKADILSSELEIRKHLIDQGYYAEANFVEENGEVVESIELLTDLPAGYDSRLKIQYLTVTRPWQYRVQAIIEGSDQLDDNNQFSPSDWSDLETVLYKFQWSDDANFTTSNELLTDRNGKRLSVSTFDTNANTVEEEGPESNPIWNDDPSDLDVGFGKNQSNRTSIVSEQDNTQQIGSSLVLGHSKLPNESGDYHWRVAAYNKFDADIQSRPRPRICHREFDTQNGLAIFRYTPNTNKDITLASASHDQYNRVSFEFSISSKPTTLEDDVPLNIVSNRRSADGTESRNLNPNDWVPPDNQHLSMMFLWDDTNMEYLGYGSRLIDNRWRIAIYKSRNLPNVIEYDSAFLDSQHDNVYKPSVCHNGSQYAMAATVQNSGSDPQVAIATSTDGIVWSQLDIVQAISVGANPSIIYKDGEYQLWFETSTGKIHRTISPDLVSWNVPSVSHQSPQTLSHPSVADVDGTLYLTVRDVDTVNVLKESGGTWQHLISLPLATSPCLIPVVYRGNTEPYLVYNTTSSDLRIARIEDRAWVNGQSTKIFSGPNQLLDVDFSDKNVEKEFSIDMATHGIAESDDVRVRLHFSEFSPTAKEYHRQSEWVYSDNRDGYPNTYLVPEVFRFDAAIRTMSY